ncbi:MAG: hypothetical protein D6826_04430, partial [Alphaproteobacteria bacterium]
MTAPNPTPVATALAAAFAFALPVVAVLAPAAVMALLLLAAAAGAVALWRAILRPAWPDRGMLAALGALVLWAALSSLWSADPAVNLMRSLRITAIVAVGAFLYALVCTTREPPLALRRAGLWLAAGVVLGCLIMAEEAALDFPILRAAKPWLTNYNHALNELNRGATAMAILC